METRKNPVVIGWRGRNHCELPIFTDGRRCRCGHVYVYTYMDFLALLAERAYKQLYLRLMSTPSDHVFVSRYYSPVTGTKAPWRNKNNSGTEAGKVESPGISYGARE